MIGAYCLAAAFGILGWWALEWAAHGMGALRTHGASHLAAELVAFGMLVASGIVVSTGGPFTQTIVPVALGMLLYATINALGRVWRESSRLGTAMAAEALATLAIIVLIALGT